MKRSDGAVKDSDNADTLKATVSAKEYQCAIARHLPLIVSVLKLIVMIVLAFYRVLGLVITLKF